MKNYSKYTNLELVQYLLGEDYEKQLYRSVLAPLFFPEEVGRPDQEIMGASTELIERWADREFLLPAPLSSPELIRAYLRAYFGAQKCEGFTVLLLDDAHQLVEMDEMGQGVVNETKVHVSAIVRRIVELEGITFILVHHLPLGKVELDSTDIWLATHLKNALAILDITIIDYFLVVGNEPISLSERGLLA